MTGFYIRDDPEDVASERGPLSAGQLQAMAQGGELTELHWVSKDRRQWYPARSVRGLILAPLVDWPDPSPAPTPQVPPTQQTVVAALQPEVRHFFTKVAGVTRDNRQQIIARCRTLEMLVLEHEPDNPVDANAMRVLRTSGEQLGYLNAELAEEVAGRLSKGYHYAAFAKEITGGRGSRTTLGVNLLIVVAEPGVSNADAQAYIKRVRRPIGPARSAWKWLTSILLSLTEATETQERKQESSSWRDDPATERQQEFADSLGITYPSNITKGELSDLISKCTGR